MKIQKLSWEILRKQWSGWGKSLYPKTSILLRWEQLHEKRQRILSRLNWDSSEIFCFSLDMGFAEVQNLYTLVPWENLVNGKPEQSTRNNMEGVSNGEEQMAKLTLSLATCKNECITSLCPFSFLICSTVGNNILRHSYKCRLIVSF